MKAGNLGALRAIAKDFMHTPSRMHTASLQIPIRSDSAIPRCGAILLARCKFGQRISFTVRHSGTIAEPSATATSTMVRENQRKIRRISTKKNAKANLSASILPKLFTAEHHEYDDNYI